jgi:hypothetical protein
MPDIPEEAVQAAEVVEKALREHLRLRLGKRALTDAMLESPSCCPVERLRTPPESL